MFGQSCSTVNLLEQTARPGTILASKNSAQALPPYGWRCNSFSAPSKFQRLRRAQSSELSAVADSTGYVGENDTEENKEDRQKIINEDGESSLSSKHGKVEIAILEAAADPDSPDHASEEGKKALFQESLELDAVKILILSRVLLIFQFFVIS